MLCSLICPRFQAHHIYTLCAAVMLLVTRYQNGAGAMPLLTVRQPVLLRGLTVLVLPAATLPQGDPLEFVVQQVLAAQGLPSAPQLLTKRQFVSLAHVAELAQSKAFDLLTAEEAAAPRTEPQGTSHKKRPPPIRDAHIDTWRIAAAPASGAAGAPADDAAASEAAGQAATAEPGGLSRATSLVPGAGPLAPSTAPLSGRSSAEGQEQGEDGGTANPEERSGAPAAMSQDAEAEAFTSKLNVSCVGAGVLLQGEGLHHSTHPACQRFLCVCFCHPIDPVCSKWLLQAVG